MEEQDVTAHLKKALRASPHPSDCTSTCPESHLAGQGSVDVSRGKQGSTACSLSQL